MSITTLRVIQLGLNFISFANHMRWVWCIISYISIPQVYHRANTCPRMCHSMTNSQKGSKKAILKLLPEDLVLGKIWCNMGQTTYNQQIEKIESNWKNWIRIAPLYIMTKNGRKLTFIEIKSKNNKWMNLFFSKKRVSSFLSITLLYCTNNTIFFILYPGTSVLRGKPIHFYFHLVFDTEFSSVKKECVGFPLQTDAPGSKWKTKP